MSQEWVRAACKTAQRGIDQPFAEYPAPRALRWPANLADARKLVEHAIARCDKNLAA
jgi:hypothetical protein